MNIVIIGIVALVLAFGLGWLSKPKYSASMSRRGQVALVVGMALVAALVIGVAVGMFGWELVLIGVVASLVFAAADADGYLRDQATQR